MKMFKVKAMAVAVGLAAAGVASAQTAGDVTLMAVNETAGYSFIYDTGLTFAQLSSTSTTLSLGTNWTTFLSDVGNSFVWMAQSAPAPTATASSIAAFTAVAGTTVPATVSFSDPTIDGYWTNYTATAHSNGMTFAAGNSIILHNTVTGQTLNWGGDNILDATNQTYTFTNGDSPWSIATSGYGSMNLYSFTLGTGRGAANTSALVDSLTLNSNGSVTLAAAGAVPEPGTYALMLAGLLAVGTVARRRMRG